MQNWDYVLESIEYKNIHLFRFDDVNDSPKFNLNRDQLLMCLFIYTIQELNWVIISCGHVVI